MSAGITAQVPGTTNTAGVQGTYQMYAFKKANQLQKDAALQLINSVPQIKPLGKYKVDILA